MTLEGQRRLLGLVYIMQLITTIGRSQRQMFCNKVVPKSFGSERLKKTPILREKLMISQKMLQAFYYYLTEVLTKVVLNRERLHALLSAESRAPSSTTSYLLPPIRSLKHKVKLRTRFM